MKLLSLILLGGWAVCLVPNGAEAQNEKTYVDPFAYCEAKGTTDKPGPEWIGDRAPLSIVQGLRRRAQLGDAMPEEMLAGQTFWRCMGGHVYACFVGANLPCMEKAEASREPTAAMNDYCQSYPSADSIPASTTGRATIYQWRCNGKEAQATDPIFHADQAGFISEFWYPIMPNS